MNSLAGKLLRHCSDWMECSSIPFAATESQMHVIYYVNPAYCRLVGKPEEELIGHPFAEAVPEGKENGCRALLDRVYNTGNAETLADQIHRHPRSHAIYWSYSAWPIRSTDGHNNELMIQVTDTTEIAIFRQSAMSMNEELLLTSVRQHEMTEMAEKLNVELQALVITDGLTGLRNHRAFQERLREEVERALRYNAPLSLLFLDLDDFKPYNDTYGHQAGDAVLRKIGEVLQATARSNDLAARYGGEEFAVILTETGVTSALLVAERVRTAIEGVRWHQRPITASIGVSTLSKTIKDPVTLIEQADKALYRSKERGRNCVTHITEAVHFAGKGRHTVQPSTPPSAPKTQRSKGNPNPDQTVSVQDTKGSLKHSTDTMVECWSQLMNLRDEETQGHSVRVMRLMEMLTKEVGMNDEEALLARRGALLHDIGKIGVSDAILHKPGPLTHEEWEVMQLHPITAFEMLSSIPFLDGPALDVPHYHHERWDGGGYPCGLKGEEIPLSARLFSVIDVYDALLSDRPYRKAWSEQEARQLLRAEKGTHFDPSAVEAFEKVLHAQKKQPAHFA